MSGVTVRGDPSFNGAAVHHDVAVRCAEWCAGFACSTEVLFAQQGAEPVGTVWSLHLPKIVQLFACHRRSKDGDIWFGRVVAFVRTPYDPAVEQGTTEWAYVRWFEQAPHTSITRLTRMARLRWSLHMQSVGSGPEELSPWYDLVRLRAVIEPVFLQPDPTEDCHFFFNHHVR